MANLLDVFKSSLTLTEDTSPSLTGFEPINLVQNLENHSCGNGLKAIKTAAIYDDLKKPNPDAKLI